MQRSHEHTQKQITLVVGASGKTGRRVAEKLAERGLTTRLASRSGETHFDWDDRTTWEAALQGVSAAYVTYSPDLAVPQAPEAIREFARLAAGMGIRRLVLLSGRGEEEAQRCERIVQEIDPGWTVVRASWFAQNFSEAFFYEPLRQGALALPAGDVGEPFVDAEDIADVAVAALTEPWHEGRIYEVTGPRLLTFAEAVGEIARASGRELRYVQVPVEDFVAELRQLQTPEPMVSLTRYLFETVLDGRNAHVTEGVSQALGRPPRDFSDYARRTAATGAWAAPSNNASSRPEEGAPPDSPEPDSPEPDSPEQVLRRFVEEVVNGGDEALLEEIIHPDYVYRSPGEELRGAEGVAALLRGYRGAFPDLRMEIDDLLVADDTTVLSFTLTGTHGGDLLGVRATGNRVRVNGMIRSRFREGKIAEEWEILDHLSLHEQLGIARRAS